jgi:hypothetical protein
MEEERIAKALARIEAAARRIESAATKPSPSSSDPDLVQRHERLREEAWAALTEIDSLIEVLEA